MIYRNFGTGTYGLIFTARCYEERGIATASRLSGRPSARLSLRDVGVSWSHRLWYNKYHKKKLEEGDAVKIAIFKFYLNL